MMLSERNEADEATKRATVLQEEVMKAVHNSGLNGITALCLMVLMVGRLRAGLEASGVPGDTLDDLVTTSLERGRDSAMSKIRGRAN